MWGRGVLKSMDWVKRKETTGKPLKQLLTEEKFTFQMSISKVFYKHNIPSEPITNLDQTPLSYISTGKYTFNIKGAKNFPVKGIDGKRQIGATFAVSIVGCFLPIQLVYTGSAIRCLTNFDFPRDFNLILTKNHWSILKSHFSILSENQRQTLLPLYVTPKSKYLWLSWTLLKVKITRF